MRLFAATGIVLAGIMLGSGGSPPLGSCTESNNFLDRTTGLDSTHIDAYDDLICGLVTDGNFTDFDALYIFATEDETTALLNLIQDAYNATVANGPITFTADEGFSNTGTTGSGSPYIRLNFNPAVDTGENYQQNDASILYWFYIEDGSNGSGAAPVFGMEDTGDKTYGIPNYLGTNNGYNQVNGATNNPVATAIGAAPTLRGLWHVVRDGASSVKVYLNGALEDTGTDSSASPENDMFVCLRGGGAFVSSVGVVSMCGFGGAMDATAVDEVNDRMVAYLTAVGAFP